MVIGILLALVPAAHAAGTVTVDVDGRGDVTGNGVSCNESGGPDCSEAYEDTTYQDCDPERKPPCIDVVEQPYVEFTAGPDRNGYAFSGWTGCDGVSGRTCGLTVDDDTTVTANFSDNAAPTIGSLSPSSGVRSGTITVSASASDNSGTVTRVDFSVGGVVVSDTTAPYSIQFNTASISDGVKTVSATAHDPSGGSATTSASITVDNTAPGLNITGGPSGQTFGPGSTQTWTFTASDATSGVQAVHCSVVPTGQAPSFGSCSGGSSSHSVTGRPDGSYTFSVRARDNAGHETIQTRSFAIDAGPPETTITSGPAEGSSLSGDVTFTFASSEPGSSFACRVSPSGITPGGFAPCSGSGTHSAEGLAPGTYTFAVVATDPFGNVDGTPATRTFTVVAPATGGNAGGTGDEGQGGPSADITPPGWTFRAGAQRSAKTKRIAFAVAATESCVLRVTAKLGRKSLGKLVKPLAAGSGSTQKLKLTKKGLTVLKQALRRKKAVRVTLVITCVDAAGNASKANRKIKVRR